MRFLAFFALIALLALLTSGVSWWEIRRPLLFIFAFITFFAFLTFLTGRGGIEAYRQLLFLVCLTLSFLSFGKFWEPPIS